MYGLSAVTTLVTVSVIGGLPFVVAASIFGLVYWNGASPLQFRFADQWDAYFSCQGMCSSQIWSTSSRPPTPRCTAKLLEICDGWVCGGLEATPAELLTLLQIRWHVRLFIPFTERLSLVWQLSELLVHLPNSWGICYGALIRWVLLYSNEQKAKRIQNSNPYYWMWGGSLLRHLTYWYHAHVIHSKPVAFRAV